LNQETADLDFPIGSEQHHGFSASEVTERADEHPLQFNVTTKTVGKWVNRFRAEGADGLRDRSSRPHSSPSQTAPATCATVEALRRER
jgi:transposase